MAGGRAACDWRGNLAADAAAREAAQSLRVEVGLRVRRHAALVHAVLGAVEVAALAAAWGGPTRARRGRTPRDGQFVRLLGRGTVTPGRVGRRTGWCMTCGHEPGRGVRVVSVGGRS